MNKDVDELYYRQGYLTDEQNERFLRERAVESYDDAKKIFEGRFTDMRFEDLQPNVRVAMTDMRFNLGHGGFSEYENFMNAVHQNDFDKMILESKRHSNHVPLTRRNNATKALLEEARRAAAEEEEYRTATHPYMWPTPDTPYYQNLVGGDLYGQ